MKESVDPLIQMETGYGRVDATYRHAENLGVWTADYFPHPVPDLEGLQQARRAKGLATRFERYKLMDPTIEILDPLDDEIDFGFEEIAHRGGAQILRVSTIIIPFVNQSELRPIRELRIPTPAIGDVQEALVKNYLRAGGSAVFDNYASAMTPRQEKEIKPSKQ